MDTFKYIHIKNNSLKLLIYFNDMTQVGFSDHFSLYKQLNTIFNDFDILFIKDIAEYYWYLTIIDHILVLINQLNETYHYQSIYGFAGSSGSMGLLNTLPKIHNFKSAIIINGQISLLKEDVNKYRNCKDCYVFSEEKIKENYHKSYLAPIEYMKENIKNYNYKIRFYHNSSLSDSINHTILKEKCKNMKNIEMIYEEHRDTPFHGNYLMKKYKNEYLEQYKKYLLS